MPTLVPGCHWVPRCRTMILPARHASPPNFFTPRRWPAESRPLRDDPPAFLCAMIVSVLWGLLFDLMTPAQRSIILEKLKLPLCDSVRGLGLRRLGLRPRLPLPAGRPRWRRVLSLGP